MQQKIELMVILRPDLDETNIKEGLKKIESLIQEEKGIVGELDIWGVRTLAYKIGQFTEGHYSVLPITIESSKVKSLQSKLKMMDNIIRFMITRT